MTASDTLRARSKTMDSPSKSASSRTPESPGNSASQPKMGRAVSLHPNVRLNLASDSRLNPIHPSLGAWRTTRRLAVLAAKLQWWLGFPGKWLIQTMRLLLFVIFMLPGFVPPFLCYMCSKKIKKNIVYGPSFRHQLDVYLPTTPANGKPYPVVIFISGGAWIIGYKAWGFIMGQIFQQCGVLFIAPDYRNFPEVTVSQMVDDVIRAVGWVYGNLESLGGDPENITLMGQSAGAHLSALAMLEKATSEADDNRVPPRIYADQQVEMADWSVTDLKRWVGISGPYNIVDVVQTMKNRGLPKSVIDALMEKDLVRFSVTRRVRDLAIKDPCKILPRLPPAHLYHGKADETCHWQHAQDLAEEFRKGAVTATATYYEGKSHTDPILEDPCEGPGDALMSDLLKLVLGVEDAPKGEGGFWRLQPKLLLKWAKICNPF
eukprot:TRINITY_DN106680_c0_g1_i1.p1 TRINITY_DN106680_c0_g1~~TRINITY_DN106680_c0_g1_i1.p1  ORF type:complete len:433 (+),score=69.31 TRINITY_DN106680_c0_g1_i1:257-1555(+)